MAIGTTETRQVRQERVAPSGVAVPPAAESILARLDDARQRWWVYSLLCGLVRAAALSVAALGAAILADVLLQLSLGWLRLVLLAWVGVSALLVGIVCIRSIRRRRSLEAAARRVELAIPALDSHLINLVQLSRATNGALVGLRRAAIEEAAARIGETRLHEAAERYPRRCRWKLGLQTARDLAEACALLAIVVGLTFAVGLGVPKWSSSWTRLFTPWRFVPQVGAVRILDVRPGSTEVLVGRPLTITATIADPGPAEPAAALVLSTDQGSETRRPVLADDTHTHFQVTLPAVVEPLQYYLQIGDSQSNLFRIAVHREPAIEDVVVTYEYPDYLDRPDEVVRQQQGDLKAPQYTVAHLRVHCSKSLARGYAQLPERRVHGRLGGNPRTLDLELPLSKPASYTIHLSDEDGFRNSRPRSNAIRVVPDAPPKVDLVKPAEETTVAPDASLPLVVRAVDDHGLGEVRLEWKRAGQTSGSAAPVAGTLRRWPLRTGATALTRTHTWTIHSTHGQPGQTLQVRAIAVDRRQVTWHGTRLAPQTAASPWRTVRVVDAAAAAATTRSRLDDLHTHLWAILRMQIAARIMAARLARAGTSAADARGKADDVRRRQTRIETDATTLVASIDPGCDVRTGTIKRGLNRLAHDEMLRAVQCAEAMVQAELPRDLRQSVLPLLALQDQIIDRLRRLLDASRRAAAAAALAEKEDRPGGDLPDDVKNKLAALANKLREMTRQQRRVIEATENLAKKPVDDFTDAETGVLRELAATEDDWSRFLAEQQSDFSKLPEQDFSNPSLLEEMVEVQTEIKMAADALTKKSVDIAVPLEQLGTEMAEELATNIEKWLPDTPDRERWSQEEPLTDEMKEAPMAELPGQLEDLVGQLMEDEEALFDEMEDVSSSWADSLDKGAGWDAADGPISNMSAKGVTGNRLPNTSEIGGRSGEGRQGKSSGEFVGDTAVGKGGRKTPSRLAPDPQVKGQVKDLSKDPVGGATGGGKQSGAGGEGLEGPTPQQAQRELRRLATRQADLRNRAETVDLKFQVLNYHHTDLTKLVQRMAAVERDLRSGRYQSALRRRDVMLDGLHNIKTYLQGEFTIRRDRTSNLPSDIQRQLLGSMQEPSPDGWQELNRKYFERLSESDKAPTARQDRPAPRGPAAARKATVPAPAAVAPGEEKR